ncbi:MAG: hypothetical protein SGPRY_003114 [Prymnesium sp.]
MRCRLLGERSESVEYHSFLASYTLAAPALEPLFPVREHMIQLAYKADEEVNGHLRLLQFRAVCRKLRRVHSDKAMMLCDRPISPPLASQHPSPDCNSSHLYAMGPPGEAALQENRLPIAEIVDAFRVS